jgi:hypothetical protein
MLKNLKRQDDGNSQAASSPVVKRIGEATVSLAQVLALRIDKALPVFIPFV